MVLAGNNTNRAVDVQSQERIKLIQFRESKAIFLSSGGRIRHG